MILNKAYFKLCHFSAKKFFIDAWNIAVNQSKIKVCLNCVCRTNFQSWNQSAGEQIQQSGHLGEEIMMVRETKESAFTEVKAKQGRQTK